MIRILFKRDASEDDQALEKRIQILGHEVAASVAMNEEELWITHYPQRAVIFPSGKNT